MRTEALDATRFVTSASLAVDGFLPDERLVEADLGNRSVAMVGGDPVANICALRDTQRHGRSLALFRSQADLERAHTALSDIGIETAVDQRGICYPLPRHGRLEDRPPLVYLTTSGTTGIPKLIGHTWERLSASIRCVDRPATWLLTYHPASFAGMQVVLTAALNGHGLVWERNATISSLAQTAVDHAPDSVSGTPTFWRSFLAALGSNASRVPIRVATLGGEAADQRVIDHIRSCFPDAVIRHIYATTELGVVFSVSDGRAGFPAAWLDAPQGHVLLRIVDGALHVARHAQGAPAAPNWFDTGDLVEVDGDRVLFSGRADSIINVGGAKVQPERVEAVLLGHPQVRDARVYAIRNPVVGQLVAADVVPLIPDLHVADLLAHARTHLPREAVPRKVNLVPELAMSAAGKKPRTST